MYPIDERDAVVELSDVQKASAGAPMPLVVADEHSLLLSYLIQADSPAG